MDIIGSNVEIQLEFVDKVKFGISSDDILMLKDYFNKKNYNMEIISESTLPKGIDSGINMFKHYAIISREKH